MTRAKTNQPTTSLGGDGHCLTVQGRKEARCQSHATTIPLGWDCCSQCPGSHKAAMLNDGKQIEGAAFGQVAELAGKMGVRFG